MGPIIAKNHCMLVSYRPLAPLFLHFFNFAASREADTKWRALTAPYYETIRLTRRGFLRATSWFP